MEKYFCSEGRHLSNAAFWAKAMAAMPVSAADSAREVVGVTCACGRYTTKHCR